MKRLAGVLVLVLFSLFWIGFPVVSQVQATPQQNIDTQIQQVQIQIDRLQQDLAYLKESKLNRKLFSSKSSKCVNLETMQHVPVLNGKGPRVVKHNEGLASIFALVLLSIGSYLG